MSKTRSSKAFGKSSTTTEVSYIKGGSCRSPLLQPSPSIQLQLMSSIDVVFDRTTVYRLHARHHASHNLFALMTSKAYVHQDPQNHPLHGRNAARRMYHAVLEAYNSPLRGGTVPPLQVAVKWVRGRQAVDRLCTEAGFYQNELRHLQGTVVPIFYGCYTARIEGVDVGCLVLEWCGGLINCSPDEL